MVYEGACEREVAYWEFASRLQDKGFKQWHVSRCWNWLAKYLLNIKSSGAPNCTFSLTELIELRPEEVMKRATKDVLNVYRAFHASLLGDQTEPPHPDRQKFSLEGLKLFAGDKVTAVAVTSAWNGFCREMEVGSQTAMPQHLDEYLRRLKNDQQARGRKAGKAQQLLREWRDYLKDTGV
jgi:hypothetical protein